MQAPYFPDWRSVYHSEHLLGILSNNSWNMFSGYIPVAIDTIFKKKIHIELVTLAAIIPAGTH